MKTETRIKIYEKNGTETEGLKYPELFVLNHWNLNSMVVLEFGKDKITVLARDLRKAIDNATNHS